MVRIRLRRSGNKHRPFYRVVVTNSSAGRGGAFIEVIGTYNPVAQPKQISLKGERALHWLLVGAQPSETTAVLLDRAGILNEFFAQRPNAKKKYAFLDKRTAAMSVKSVVEPMPPAPEEPVAVKTDAVEEVAEEVTEPGAEVVAEATPEVVAAVEAEAPAAEAPAATEEA